MKSDANRALIEKFLKNMPIFRGLSETHLVRVSDNFCFISVKKGEIIFYESDACTDMYMVLDGVVRASLINQEGQELILATFNSGDFFGEMSLLDGNPRSATVIAAEDSVLGILKREQFLSVIKNEPMIAIELLSALVQRLRMTDEMIGSIAFLDVSHRIVKLLLGIANTECVTDANAAFLRINKLTQKELAARTGATREAVSKALKLLVFKGIIKEEAGHFLVSRNAENI